MPRIPPIHRSQAPQAALDAIDQATGNSGETWNVFEGAANNPAILQGLTVFREAMGGELSEKEHEVIALQVARHNGCGYCFPAHRYLALQYGLSAQEIDSVESGHAEYEDPDLQQLDAFVCMVMAHKGKLPDEEFVRFQSGGLDHGKMIAVLAVVAYYTFMNYFNRLAGTEIEDTISPFVSDKTRWVTRP